MSSGTSAPGPLFASTRRNSASATRATTKAAAATIGAPCDSMAASARPPSASAPSAWAGASKLRSCGSDDSGIDGRASASAATPNGTTTRKMLRQPKLPISRPPTVGPIAMREAVAAGPDAERMAAFGLVAPHHADDGERRRHRQRRADARQRTAGDQHADRRCGSAQQRCGGEYRHADHEDAAPAVEIGQQAAGQQQHGIDEVVGVEHPLQGADAGVEIIADRPRREVDHRHVDLGHQHGETEREQGEALVVRHTHTNARIRCPMLRKRSKWRPLFGLFSVSFSCRAAGVPPALPCRN